MTDLHANQQDANKENYGAQLSSARTGLGMSVQQVAQQLNLPTERIDEIESGEFNQAISPTFYRGYIRSYAQLLKLSDSDILAGYNGALSDTVELKALGSIGGVDAARREVNTRSSIFQWFTTLIVIAILVVAAWGIKERFFDNKADAENASGEISGELFGAERAGESSINNESGSITLPNKVESNEVPAETGAERSGFKPSAKEPSVNETLTIDSENIPASNITPISGTVQNSDASLSSEPVKSTDTDLLEAQTSPSDISSMPANLEDLTFAFIGDCWIEVKDDRGERLAYGLKKSGQVMSLSGLAPFKIVLGDAAVVQLKRGDELIDLSAYRPGQTANLTVK